MATIANILLGLYVVALIYIMVFCLMQFHLLYHYGKNAEVSSQDFEDTKDEDLPFVTIQLPIYNELYVVERLVDNIAKFDYPKDKYEIHILDDSTDETMQIALAKVEEYKAKGFNIEHITRSNRVGYKAGALKEGTKFAKGKFLAIFDADFLPNPDFLRQTIPHFADEKVGVVQTRWEHINEDYSLITRLQAFQLNVHFTVEQMGRYNADYLLQFNGTAGIWRRECITDAGGWEADTLTEDLDLSYRAQFKGWKITFLEDITSPAELPAEMNGLKSQQHRWMKGGAETAVKLLPTVWKSNISLGQKIHATSHLLSSSIFLFVFFIGVSSVPLVFMLKGFDFDYLGFFLISLLTIIVVYYNANVRKAWKDGLTVNNFLKFIFLFPVFLALSMGLSFHNSIAVIQGLRGKKSPFVRTPKFDIKGLTDSFAKDKYHYKDINKVTIFEGLLAIYFMMAIIGAIVVGNTSFIIFHTLLAFGYSTIFFFSIKHSKTK
ncbi:glycosyltransferase family 2 protein [Saprospiraceae bacterium]|nr:glycosyltransferase family 2 protein [Saprospiraceae bacterium]MDB4162747.1 glycosyltransferase family 2 protein [Saprospiraceae bacterium]